MTARKVLRVVDVPHAINFRGAVMAAIGATGAEHRHIAKAIGCSLRTIANAAIGECEMRGETLFRLIAAFPHVAPAVLPLLGIDGHVMGDIAPMCPKDAIRIASEGVTILAIAAVDGTHVGRAQKAQEAPRQIAMWSAMRVQRKVA